MIVCFSSYLKMLHIWFRTGANCSSLACSRGGIHGRIRRRLFISYAQDFGFIGRRQHGLSGLFYLLGDFVLGCCKLYSLMQPSMGDETLRCLALAL